ncbi:endonuclease MutS2 [Pediococcus argentinicus]|uniref:Endonuclease MutS2 n=1 Tax=Pediococcus argentinicus TaxID=480391 RepID=A0A0R2NHH7_9LACO|nr:endonuclease MutS2 [Pediococcus argentinicus]KRO25263.1 MutS family ATPase [Pediococcus argentinicus]NKZ22330.1 endonuclease MutS2 [Pediococcus argentinicus]GEP19447.1 endonuclease MutS2 [Pediococcus argentinicus]
MNKKILDILEYQKVKDAIKDFLGTANGQQELLEMFPKTDVDSIQKDLTETLDAVDIYRVKSGIPIPKLANIVEPLRRLKIEATLNGQELAQIGQVLRATREVTTFFQDLVDEEINIRVLNQKVDQLVLLPEVEHRLSESIEGNGHLTNAASPELRKIRTNISRLESEVRSKMEKYTRGANAKYLSDPIVTIRNDRYVIPVKSDSRSRFGGVVHDQSASGLTFYIEPEAVVDLNNQLRQNQLAEIAEEQRIFQELSELLIPYRDDLRENSWVLGHLDLLNGKAKYAHKLHATEPRISGTNVINLRQVRHPLLDQNKAVANDIKLGDDYQTLIITGPNTGGKTITLKTVGLIQLMAQSGLFIPANENSTVGIFKEVFADIGDEQSIEQNLSTFSSHMDNIIQILDKLDHDSLVLFDELGAGTDPKEGAALAIAILARVRQTGSMAMATTHYPELKTYGYERPATINASMEFDVATLQPTYKLLIGIPGQSNAFEISNRLGLDTAIIDQARGLVDQDSQDLNNMIKDLTSRQKHTTNLANDLESTLKDSNQLRTDLSRAVDSFQRQRTEMVEKAKEEANQIVNDSQETADKIIKRLRKMEHNAGYQENDLIEAKSKLNSLRQDTNLKRNRVLNRAKARQELHPNDEVIVTSYGQKGELIRKADQNHWEVQLGIIKMKVSVDELELVESARSIEKRTRTNVRRTASVSVKTTLDLRGKRYEEAMVEVDRYIDAAILAGYDQVTIVHGKGTGALRAGITKYLQANKRIKDFGYAPANAGGNGATIVKLR